MKKEAVRRLKMLGILDEAIGEFERNQTVILSGDLGYLHRLTAEQKEIVRKFERRTGNLVYHVLRSVTPMGEMLSMLYVSDDPDGWEWEFAREDLRMRLPVAYVVNLDHEDLSEYGTIVIKPLLGGVIRTF